MKYLSLIFLFILFSEDLKAQDRFMNEIKLSVSGVSSQQSITFTFDAAGPVWAWDELTTSYDNEQETTVGNIDSTAMNYGWNIYWSDNGDYDEYAHGLYKLSTNYDDGFVYIDFRDSKYANPEYGGGDKYDADFRIHYFGYTDEFGYKDDQPRIQKMSNASVTGIWVICNGGISPITTTFEDFWENCLGMTYNSNGNPRIVWRNHPSFSPISGYKIYRAIIYWWDSPADPEDFELEATVNSSTYMYTDYDPVLNENGDNEVWYYVKAYYEHPKTHNITYSLATNSVCTDPVEFNKPFGERETTVSKYNLKLYQNYPNPFNPITKISFDLPIESIVKLQIYDVQGKLISTVLNKKVDSGNHSVTFDSDGLPSGVYFYRLKTAEFSDIKRMLLVK